MRERFYGIIRKHIPVPFAAKKIQPVFLFIILTDLKKKKMFPNYVEKGYEQ
jgi:hypothetical protein